MPTTHRVTTADGRALHVVETGDTAGAPVLAHHGTPSGAEPVFAPWAESATKRGIRLIFYDRPGYGPSTPQTGRTIANAAGDAAAIADALGIERLATWGVSGGGPHALACAALLPDRISAAATIGSPAPYDADGLDWLEGQGEDNVVEHRTAAEGVEPLRDLLDPPRRAMLDAGPEQLADELASLLTAVDRDALRGDLAAYMLAASQHGLEQRHDGWIDDDRAFVTPWAFSPADIRVPVKIWHGVQDRFVPASHGRWLAERIPGAEADISDDDGHVTLMWRVPEVHEWLMNR